MNPSKSPKTDEKISELIKDVVSLQAKGDVIIQGDLNARTGNIEDFISPDKYDELLEINFDNPPPKRN